MNLIEENAKEKRKVDSDLSSAFAYNPQEDFGVDDIDNVVAAVYGENDGYNWYWLVTLKEGALMRQAGEYALLTGGCDYTGWDCQSSLSTLKHGNLEECLAAVPVEEGGSGRRILETVKKQLAFELPFGVIEA